MPSPPSASNSKPGPTTPTSSPASAKPSPTPTIIRDLGYFVIKVLEKISLRGAFFLSRYRYDVRVFDAVTDRRLDLETLLQPGQALDRQVRIGAEKMPARLVACPVPQALADERRPKAKANRDRRLNPSKRKLYLLSWNIRAGKVTKKRRSVLADGG